MKNILFLLLIALFSFSSCKEQDLTPETEPNVYFDEPNWTKLEVPAGGEVLAVAGNIEDTLLVTTLYKSYLTVDQGKTWQESKNFYGSVSGLLLAQDTIFALTAHGYDGNFEKSYASIAQYYTLDKGFHWSNFYGPEKSLQTGIVQTEDSTVIQLHYHSGPDKEGNGSNYVLKTTISVTHANGITDILHPSLENKQPNNLYLDKQERLYIPTGGPINDVGVLISRSASQPAYLYVSKRPIAELL